MIHKRLVICLLLLVAGCTKSTDGWLEQSRDADVVKRRQAVRELGSRDAEAEKVVPALVVALSDENHYVRRDAAVALGRLGADACPAVPALLNALEDSEESVRKAAAASLKKIDPKAAPARSGVQ